MKRIKYFALVIYFQLFQVLNFLKYQDITYKFCDVINCKIDK